MQTKRLLNGIYRLHEIGREIDMFTLVFDVTLTLWMTNSHLERIKYVEIDLSKILHKIGRR